MSVPNLFENLSLVDYVRAIIPKSYFYFKFFKGKVSCFINKHYFGRKQGRMFQKIDNHIMISNDNFEKSARDIYPAELRYKAEKKKY